MSRLTLTSVEPGSHTEEEKELFCGGEGYTQKPWDENTESISREKSQEISVLFKGSKIQSAS